MRRFLDIQPLTLKRLLHAYAIGLFPMADSFESTEIYWVDPHKRGIIPLENLRISSSLAKALRKQPLVVKVDINFTEIVDACAQTRPDQADTWINKPIREVFLQLHGAGLAHSIAVMAEEQLVGGLYGLALGGAFFGESMFHRRTNASKIALVHLAAILRLSGFSLLDTQFLTPHLASLGAIELSRRAYHHQLKQALASKARFNHWPSGILLPELAGSQTLSAARTGQLDSR